MENWSTVVNFLKLGKSFVHCYGDIYEDWVRQLTTIVITRKFLYSEVTRVYWLPQDHCMKSLEKWTDKSQLLVEL